MNLLTQLEKQEKQMLLGTEANLCNKVITELAHLNVIGYLNAAKIFTSHRSNTVPGCPSYFLERKACH